MNATIKIDCHFNVEKGEWQVFAPNGHYRHCTAGHLEPTCRMVLNDYADWIKSAVNIEKLVPAPHSLESDGIWSFKK